MFLEGKIHRDDEDCQRYITERIYVDRRSKNIVDERTLLLKDGKKHKCRSSKPYTCSNTLRQMDAGDGGDRD
jgi:hypothetical protein